MLVGVNKALHKPSFTSPLEKKRKANKTKPCCSFKAHANTRFLHFSPDFKHYSH